MVLRVPRACKVKATSRPKALIVPPTVVVLLNMSQVCLVQPASSFYNYIVDLAIAPNCRALNTSLNICHP